MTAFVICVGSSLLSKTVDMTLIWSGNSQCYLIRQEGIPKTGQGIQCKMMEYTFCHFIIIFVKYNK